jgi:hypothetical protein
MQTRTRAEADPENTLSRFHIEIRSRGAEALRRRIPGQARGPVGVDAGILVEAEEHLVLLPPREVPHAAPRLTAQPGSHPDRGAPCSRQDRQGAAGRIQGADTQGDSLDETCDEGRAATKAPSVEQGRGPPTPPPPSL